MEKRIITVKIIPNAKENSISQTIGCDNPISYNIRTTAKPKNNEANEAVIRIISEHLQIAKSKIKIIKGLHNKIKIIEIFYNDKTIY